MKKAIFGILVVMLIAGGVAAWFFSRGPDLTQYESLVNPRITTQANRKMLVVEAKGDPNEMGEKAFGLLFKTFYKLEGRDQGFGGVAPRARWAASVDDSMNEWIGYYALPVGDLVTSLPEIEAEPGLSVRLETWEYGQVAEILHIGSYSKEQPTIRKLHQFIEDQGYRMAGLHEEEYLKGPGMFFKGDPETYYTIIRYRVEKKP
ncbi:MAG: hypothetical protein GY866_37180 [Proteobacteria bacterium]|nr:hypothetical protein [Pseudomonadota bacterium]